MCMAGTEFHVQETCALSLRTGWIAVAWVRIGVLWKFTIPFPRVCPDSCLVGGLTGLSCAAYRALPLSCWRGLAVPSRSLPTLADTHAHPTSQRFRHGISLQADDALRGLSQCLAGRPDVTVTAWRFLVCTCRCGGRPAFRISLRLS
jgi:hypothetical protein